MFGRQILLKLLVLHICGGKYKDFKKLHHIDGDKYNYYVYNLYVIKFILFTVIIFGLNCIRSVSYTHLDVYKRQVLDSLV